MFDLSGVAFMDTMIPHQIVDARSLLARSGRATVIRKPTPFVHRLLAICQPASIT
jgi:anti-anti-sigma regulatory factor